MVASQTKGFRIITYHGPPSPLAAKSRRFHSNSVATTPVPLIPDPPYCFNSMDEVVERQPTPASATTINDPTPPVPTSTEQLKTSYDALEAQSQLLRQSFVAQNQEGKKTGGTYERHYKNFTAWWDDHEARLAQENPSYMPIPAVPITVAKVTLFLHHEMTRPQVRILEQSNLKPY
ncbi:hypothetical protein B0H13DRAFT_1888161 [Mycena leptocephala]|nr:hypothetical protein B0H13DRAFT_1891158 [Mycena leptocephala]KAJ7889026.1 hypothetical protein B0H13DRAFT_1888161 [Mycena leptocephala]